MRCLSCGTEYEASSCPNCGAQTHAETPPEVTWALDFSGQLTKKWPRLPDGAAEEPAFLVHRSSINMEDKLTINMLDAYGVPLVAVAPGSGCFGKLIMGTSADGTDIYVPVSFLEDAKALLEEPADD
ncbi:MAG: hypothetical protein LBM18_02590 [Oscillospiraceae bacterium]|jgi:hypothetical protein|nr:hypothetical protein [Oscillospiraceae bacterium]